MGYVSVKERLLSGVNRTSIRIGDTCSGVDPLIYLEDLYGYMKDNNSDISYAYKKWKELISDAGSQKEEINDMLNKALSREYFVKNVYFCIINKKMNDELLKKAPYFDIKSTDLVGIYRLLISDDNEGVSSMIISKDVLMTMDLDEKELYTLAMDNTPRLFPSVMDTMENMLYTKYGIKVPSSDLFILTNSRGVNGAGTMCYPGLLASAAKEYNRVFDDNSNRFLIIPSSVHELIMCSCSLYGDIKSIIASVNTEVVDEKDVLSYNAYIYDMDKDIIEMI